MFKVVVDVRFAVLFFFKEEAFIEIELALFADISFSLIVFLSTEHFIALVGDDTMVSPELTFVGRDRTGDFDVEHIGCGSGFGDFEFGGVGSDLDGHGVFVEFAEDLVVGVGTELLHHLFDDGLFSLALKHEDDAVDGLPAQSAGFIGDFRVKDLEWPFDWVVELRGSFVGVYKEVHEHFLDFGVLGFDKPL